MLNSKCLIPTCFMLTTDPPTYSNSAFELTREAASLLTREDFFEGVRVKLGLRTCCHPVRSAGELLLH